MLIPLKKEPAAIGICQPTYTDSNFEKIQSILKLLISVRSEGRTKLVKPLQPPKAHSPIQLGQEEKVKLFKLVHPTKA